MQPAQDRGLRKTGRDIFQALVAVVGAGGAYAIIDLLVGSVSPVVGVFLAFFFKFLVTYAQNYLETKGTIPAMLPSPGLITTAPGGAVGTVVGTVDAIVTPAAAGATQVVGDVVSTAGKVVGGVAGAAGGLISDVENLGGL